MGMASCPFVASAAPGSPEPNAAMTWRMASAEGCRSDGLRGRLDEARNIRWVRDHRDVARLDLDGRRAHPGRELALGVGRERLVALGHQVPARERLPRGHGHDVGEGGAFEWLLDGPHRPPPRAVHLAGE